MQLTIIVYQFICRTFSWLIIWSITCQKIVTNPCWRVQMFFFADQQAKTRNIQFTIISNSKSSYWRSWTRTNLWHFSNCQHEFPSTGTYLFLLEDASWQSSLWASTARFCSPLPLSLFCLCALWIQAVSTPGCLVSRFCGKPSGTCLYSTGNTTCKSLSASGTNLKSVHWYVNWHLHALPEHPTSNMNYCI